MGSRETTRSDLGRPLLGHRHVCGHECGCRKPGLFDCDQCSLVGLHRFRYDLEGVPDDEVLERLRLALDPKVPL